MKFNGWANWFIGIILFWIEVGDEDVDELIEDAEFKVTKGFPEFDEFVDEDDEFDDVDEDDVVEDDDEPGVCVFAPRAAANIAAEDKDCWALCCCDGGGGGGGAKWLKCAAGINPLVPFNRFAAATKFELNWPAFAAAINCSALAVPLLKPYSLSAPW